MTTDYKTVLYSVEDAVAVIRMNRPERRNAFTPEMLTELNDAFHRAEQDSAVRIIVLTGEGPTFSAGQDLSIFTGEVNATNVREAIKTYYKPLILRMTSMPKIVIGAINGGAAGAGASVALACDLRIMDEDGYLLQAFSNIGLVPDAGSTWFMARMVGYSRALQFCIEAERISAPRCLQLGLCNQIVAGSFLMHKAMEWAKTLAQRPSKALGWTKQALNASMHSSLEAAIDYEADLQALAIATQDHKEGVMAFLQKRAPVFRGE
uniref:Enoyl-CoA hydratase n=1 Tax=Caldilinea aerophila TaxID=133453 RepID=A0A7C1JRT8_9CHLR